jgi:hypothetical protein
MTNVESIQTTPPKRETVLTLNHVFPLRQQTALHFCADAMLTIPRDLSAAEAERICAWIKTLAAEWSTP